MIFEQTLLTLIGGGMVLTSIEMIVRNLRGDNKKKKVITFFNNAGLCNKNKQYPLMIDFEEKDGYDFYVFHIPSGLDIEDFGKKEKALENVLKGHIDMWSKYSTLYIRKSNNAMKEKVNYDKQFISEQLDNYRLGIPIGYTRDKFIVHDLLGQGSHILVAATTNFGKTNFLHSCICSFMYNYSPKRVLINPLDLKNGTEFRQYINSPHRLHYADNKKDAAAILSGLKEELDKRTKLMRKHNLNKIHKLNKPYIITVIDEFAVLAKDENAINDLIFLCQQGRAAGLHFIVSTQYPKANIIPTDIRINFDVRIALHLAERPASEVVLGNTLASELPEIPGRAIYKFGKCQEVQIPYLEKLPTFKEKKKEVEKEATKKDKGAVF